MKEATQKGDAVQTALMRTHKIIRLTLAYPPGEYIETIRVGTRFEDSSGSGTLIREGAKPEAS